MSPKVFIVQPNYDVVNMFQRQGWEFAKTIKEADLIQFTGGADVTPSLYNQAKHKETHFNPLRDQNEIVIYQVAKKLGKPMAGICRGGQFLNVMCGGSLWQHVDKHNLAGTHLVMDDVNGEIFSATSTHHQMMEPSADGFVIGYATESTSRERCDHRGHIYCVPTGRRTDPEIVFYEKNKCFCYQPHPEGVNDEEGAFRYFKYLDDYLLPLPKKEEIYAE